MNSKLEAKENLIALPIVALMMIIHAVLCFGQGMTTGIWKDEAVTFLNAWVPTTSELLAVLPKFDINPPLYFMIMHEWIKLFSASELSMKGFSLICGMLLIAATYALGVIVKSPRCGLLAALFATFSAQTVHFSVEVRSYALAALFFALSTCTFVQGMKQDSSARKAIWLTAFAILAALSIYINYMGIIFCGCLGVWTAYRILWQRGKPTVLHEVVLNIMPFVLIFLMFAPWIPVFLPEAKNGTPWATRPSILMWPIVVWSNLGSVLPYPFFLSMFILVVIFIWALFHYKLIAVSLKNLPKLLGSSTYGPLLTSAIISISVFGYVTPFYYGYYRYVYPFTAITMVLLSAFLQYSCTAIVQRIGKNASKQRRRSAFALAILIVLFFCSNTWVAFAKQKPRSGLQALAKDIKDNSYPETAFMIGPDDDYVTLAFYTDVKSYDYVSPFIHGFAQWQVPVAASMPHYAEPWQKDDLIGKATRNVEQLERNRYKHLAVMIDQTFVADSPQVPARKNVDGIFNAIKDRYRLERVLDYPATTEHVKVFVFDLSKRP